MALIHINPFPRSYETPRSTKPWFSREFSTFFGTMLFWGVFFTLMGDFCWRLIVQRADLWRFGWVILGWTNPLFCDKISGSPLFQRCFLERHDCRGLLGDFFIVHAQKYHILIVFFIPNLDHWHINIAQPAEKTAFFIGKILLPVLHRLTHRSYRHQLVPVAMLGMHLRPGMFKFEVKSFISMVKYFNSLIFHGKILKFPIFP